MRLLLIHCHAAYAIGAMTVAVCSNRFDVRNNSFRSSKEATPCPATCGLDRNSTRSSAPKCIQPLQDETATPA